MIKIRVVLVLVTLFFVLGVRESQAQLSWGAICDETGKPFEGFQPDLVGLGTFPNNPYTAPDLAEGLGVGCSWKLLPIGENVYISPASEVGSAQTIGYSFWYQSPVVQNVKLGLLAYGADDTDYSAWMNVELPATGDIWSEMQFMYDGGTTEPLAVAAISFTLPDGPFAFYVDDISIAGFAPTTGTPTPTGTPVVLPTSTPSGQSNVCYEFEFDGGTSGWQIVRTVGGTNDLTGDSNSIISTQSGSGLTGHVAQSSSIGYTIRLGDVISVDSSLTGGQSTYGFWLGLSSGQQPAVFYNGTMGAYPRRTNSLDLSIYAGDSISYFEWKNMDSQTGTRTGMIYEIVVINDAGCGGGSSTVTPEATSTTTPEATSTPTPFATLPYPTAVTTGTPVPVPSPGPTSGATPTSSSTPVDGLPGESDFGPAATAINAAGDVFEIPCDPATDFHALDFMQFLADVLSYPVLWTLFLIILALISYLLWLRILSGVTGGNN